MFDSPEYAGLGTIREDQPLTALDSLQGGYAQSKCVAEKLVRTAGERGMPVTVYRPGRITADSETGAESLADYTTLLLRLCMEMHMAPSTEDRVDMTPVDYVARAVVGLAQREESLGKTFHLVNPRPVPVRDVYRAIRADGSNFKKCRSTPGGPPRSAWRRHSKDQSFVAFSHWLMLMAPLSPSGQPVAPSQVSTIGCDQTQAALQAIGLECPVIERRPAEEASAVLDEKEGLSHETAAALVAGVLEDRVPGRPDRGRQRRSQRRPGGLDPAHACATPIGVVGGHDAGLFAALCVVILVTRIGSQMVLCRMTQANIAELRIGLCRRILESPLKHLEEIGIDRMLGSLTGDVNLVSQAINGVPVLAVNLVILVCGAVYLGSLSLSLLAGCLVFAVLGFASYWYSSRWASKYVTRSRQAQDVLLKRVRGLIEGVKELKMHHDRRREYVDQVVRAARRGPREPVPRRHPPRCGRSPGDD